MLNHQRGCSYCRLVDIKPSERTELLQAGKSVVDLRGCKGHALQGSKFFQSMQFLGKFGKIVFWCPLLESLCPQPQGNPGSATVSVKPSQRAQLLQAGKC